MKIVLAVHHFPPRYKGGAEWETYRIARRLIRRGNVVQVICVENVDKGSSAGVVCDEDTYDDISVMRLSMNLKKYPDKWGWEVNNRWIAGFLVDYLRVAKPDIFHMISGYLISGGALEVSKSASIPTVVSLMDYWFLCKRLSLMRSDGSLSELPINSANCVKCIGEEDHRLRYLGKKFPALMQKYWNTRKSDYNFFEKRSQFLLEKLNSVDLIIARSRFIQSIYIRAGVDPEKIVFQRQGLELEEEKIQLNKIPSDHLRIGYIGQISEQKGLHVLLQAVKLLRDVDCKVRIYGNKEAFPEFTLKLDRLIENDSRVEFSGVFGSNKEMSQVYQNLDVLVVPSIWYENSPNVILEAFARKTPVITSDLGGMAELVTNGKNGLLFQPGNPEDLAIQLHKLINDRDMLLKFQNNIEPVKSITSEVEELEQLYKGIIH